MKVTNDNAELRFPLTTRRPDEAIAYVGHALNSLSVGRGFVSVDQFLLHVEIVANLIPNKAYALNLCANRYLFLVSFCAVICRGQCNLLPQNKTVSAQEQIASSYHDAYVIHDGLKVSPSLESFDLLGADFKLQSSGKKTPSDIPSPKASQLACIAFTSGSTGVPKPNKKLWQTLVKSTEINIRNMVPPLPTTIHEVATMPSQHMWGLETSILIPLFANVCVSDSQSLFPHNILRDIADLPEPRLLVSTPIHLKSLVSADGENPNIHSVLTATSPVSSQLAEQVETHFNSELREVYGCTEVGSMAIRRPSREEEWSRFDGIVFTLDNAGYTSASADHLVESALLQDDIVLRGGRRFLLRGRLSDQVKIAGKRESLSAINTILLNYEGVSDGVVFQREPIRENTRLTALVVVKDGYDKSSLLAYLRKHLDSSFVPRYIHFVPLLPRGANGKLSKADLDRVLESLA